eukprot:jgi/Chlat1/6367/Chrsp44S05834
MRTRRQGQAAGAPSAEPSVDGSEPSASMSVETRSMRRARTARVGGEEGPEGLGGGGGGQEATSAPSRNAVSRLTAGRAAARTVARTPASSRRSARIAANGTSAQDQDDVTAAAHPAARLEARLDEVAEAPEEGHDDSVADGRDAAASVLPPAVDLPPPTLASRLQSWLQDDDDESEASDEEDRMLERALQAMRGETGVAASNAAHASNDAGSGDEGFQPLALSEADRRALAAAAAAKEISWNPETGLGRFQHDEGEEAPSAPELPGSLLKSLTVPPLDSRRANRLAAKVAPDTAGSNWYDLPAPTLTTQLKRELQLLKLRSVTDPKRFYKSADSSKYPKYFQIGTVIEGPADFYSSRLSQRERKQTITDELLADQALKSYRKRKYLQIQDAKQSGGRGFYKKVKNKRKPSWAKD